MKDLTDARRHTLSEIVFIMVEVRSPRIWYDSKLQTPFELIGIIIAVPR